MSMVYWVCQGIGIEQSAIIPFLDGEKLAQVIIANEPDEDVSNQIEVEVTAEELEEEFAFSTLADEEKVNVLLDIISGDTHQLPSVLRCADKKHVLEACSNNDGLYFLLYPPSYPWEEPHNMFKTKNEVFEYICDVLMQFCRNDISRQTIKDIIDDDIYEPGAG